MNVIVIVLLSSFTVLSSANNGKCSTKFSELEKSLYEDGRNLLNMEEAFFPSVGQPSRFLRVQYVFTNEYDEDDCSVTFFWSVGSFLFLQPPSVFTYTSLLFNFPSNMVSNLTIVLPNECQPLVINNNNNNSDDCTCDKGRITFLDMLTRHVSLFFFILNTVAILLSGVITWQVCNNTCPVFKIVKA